MTCNKKNYNNKKIKYKEAYEQLSLELKQQA